MPSDHMYKVKDYVIVPVSLTTTLVSTRHVCLQHSLLFRSIRGVAFTKTGVFLPTKYWSDTYLRYGVYSEEVFV